jgi:hypothetical protein
MFLDRAVLEIVSVEVPRRLASRSSPPSLSSTGEFAYMPVVLVTVAETIKPKKVKTAEELKTIDMDLEKR